jgi:hypothetical protein
MSELFIQNTAGLAPFYLSLENTGDVISTVTSTTRISESSTGERFFVKENGQEYQQLSLLQACGVPVPKTIALNTEASQFASIASGEPLPERLQDVDARNGLLTRAGQTLHDIHRVLNDSIWPSSATAQTYANTSHIADCFFYKFIGRQEDMTLDEYRAHKGNEDVSPDNRELVSSGQFVELSETYGTPLRRLVTQMNDIGDTFIKRLEPHCKSYGPQPNLQPKSYLTIVDTDICYGDFKPENIVVDEEGAITVLDPIITQGSKYFDLAKFTARTLIDVWPDQISLKPFFEGYGLLPTEEIKVYGPLSFSDLVCMDMLNILKTYTKRYRSGDTSYRITAQLGNPDFCDDMSALLAKLMHVTSTAEFDNTVLAKGC